MKKLIASILTLALLIGIVPATLTANAATEQDKSIKVLAIGEEFSRSGFDYLYKVMEAEGYSDISVAYLFDHNTAGIKITDYAARIPDDEASGNYAIGCNERDFTNNTVLRYNLRQAIQLRDWDYIVLNTAPIQSGQESEFTAALDTMIAYINRHKTNPNVKIGWHLNWAYQKGYEDEQFTSVYGGDPDTMYKAIVNAAKQVEKKVDFVVPVGTAVMNMKSSYIGDVQVDAGELAADPSNLNELGKLIASYTWYAKLTGTKLTNLNFTDAFLVNLSSADKKVVMEAVNNAIKTPYAVTESSYKTEPTQYNVTVNGNTQKCLPGDVIEISAQPERNAGRTFQGWTVVKGNVILGNPKTLTTSFTVPAQDVEVKAQYTAQQAGQLKVGFGRADVTPTESVSMWGNGDQATRFSDGTVSEEDKIEITAVAVSDGNQTNVMITMDFLYVGFGCAEAAELKVAEKFKELPVGSLLFSATHTHSSVLLETGNSYYPVWEAGLLEAVEMALNDLKEVSETKTSSTKVPGMNWQRHWRYVDGTVGGINFEHDPTGNGTGYRGVLEETDQDLQVIRFVRSGDTKDIVLINWQGHANMASAKMGANSFGTQHYNELSADYPGYLRRYVEKYDGDCQVAFFLGASGNVTTSPRMTFMFARWGRPMTYSPIEYGEKMGAYTMEAMENMTTVETGAVRSMNQVQAVCESGYTSTLLVPQDVVAIGGSIAFATAPYEMFDQNGLHVKKSSPFDMTFVMTCGQRSLMGGYVPEWQTWFYYPELTDGLGLDMSKYPVDKVRPYEVRTSSAVRGTGEDLADGLVAMLNALYTK